VYEPVGSAFPSGHTTAGIYGWVTVGVVAVVLLPAKWRPLGWVAIGIGLLMGPARLVLGVHWLGDVLAGLLLASAWVLGVTAVLLAPATRPASSALGSVTS
jgi:undecaprenyl-diphosphatase